MKEEIEIYWNGIHAGTYTIIGVDMWYLDGEFVPANSETAAAFHKAISDLDVKQVFNDLDKGISCVLHPKSPTGKPWNGIVLGYVDEILVLRSVYSKSPE